MTTIQKWGNSLGLRIPQAVAEDVGLMEGTQVLVGRDGDILTVRRIPHHSLKELLKGVTSDNKHEKIDWGPPQGKEIW